MMGRVCWGDFVEVLTLGVSCPFFRQMSIVKRFALVAGPRQMRWPESGRVASHPLQVERQNLSVPPRMAQILLQTATSIAVRAVLMCSSVPYTIHPYCPDLPQCCSNVHSRTCPCRPDLPETPKPCITGLRGQRAFGANSCPAVVLVVVGGAFQTGRYGEIGGNLAWCQALVGDHCTALLSCRSAGGGRLCLLIWAV